MVVAWWWRGGGVVVAWWWLAQASVKRRASRVQRERECLSWSIVLASLRGHGHTHMPICRDLGIGPSWQLWWLWWGSSCVRTWSSSKKPATPVQPSASGLHMISLQ